MKFRNREEKLIWENAVSSFLLEVDNRKKIIKVFGVDQEVADRAHELSNKQSVWITDKAKKMSPNDPMRFFTEKKDELDKLFGEKGLLKLQEKPQTNLKSLSFDEAVRLIDVYKEIVNWLNDPSVPSVDLTKMSWNEAETKSKEWREKLNSGEEIESEEGKILHKFPDGFYFVLMETNECDVEAGEMDNCGKASQSDMYLISLRKKGSPYVTIDWHPKDKYIIQIKGKQNLKPEPKYHKYIKWLIGNPNIVHQLKTDQGHQPETNFQLGDLSNEDFKDVLNSNKGLKFPIEYLDKEKFSYVPQETIDNFVLTELSNDNSVEEFFMEMASQGVVDKYVTQKGKNGEEVYVEILSMATPEVQQGYWDDYVFVFGERGYEIDEQEFLMATPDAQKKYLFMFLRKHKSVSIDEYILKRMSKRDYVEDEFLKMASQVIQQDYWDYYVKKRGRAGYWIGQYVNKEQLSMASQEVIDDHILYWFKEAGEIKDKEILSLASSEVQQQYFDKMGETLNESRKKPFNARRVIREEIQREMRIYEINKKFNESNLVELYPGTYRYNGKVVSYHLSTSKDLILNKSFDYNKNKESSKRGGGGDYIYASDEYNEWISVFKKETPNNVPKYLYKVELANPKFKKESNIFGQYTPSQYLGEPESTIVLEYIKEI